MLDTLYANKGTLYANVKLDTYFFRIPSTLGDSFLDNKTSKNKNN